MQKIKFIELTEILFILLENVNSSFLTAALVKKSLVFTVQRYESLQF